MKKIYFTVYYFLTLAITLFNMRTYFKLPFPTELTSSPFQFISLLVPYLVVAFSILGLLGFHKKIILFFTITLFSIYTVTPFIVYGKTNNTLHAFIYGSVCLLFLNLKKPLYEKSNKIILRTAQALILSTYFTAGVAKVIAFAKTLNPWSELFSAPTEHLAYAVGEGGGPHILLFDLIQHKFTPTLLAAGFLLTILFELSAVIPVFKMNLIKYYGLAIISFHILCSIALGVWFVEAILASAFFFIFTENFVDQFSE